MIVGAGLFLYSGLGSAAAIAADVQRGSSRTDVVGIWDHGSCRRCAVKVPFRGVPVESRRMILNA